MENENKLKSEKLLKYYLNPSFENVLVSINEETQDKIVDHLKTDSFLYDKKTYYTININGKKLFNDLRKITAASHQYLEEDIEKNIEYYELQNTPIDNMSEDELEEFSKNLLTKAANKETGQRFQSIITNVYESYFISEILLNIKKIVEKNNIKTNSYSLKEIKIEELNEFQELIKNGLIEESYEKRPPLYWYNLINICSDFYRDGIGFLVLINNAENILDENLQTVINILISNRKASPSVTIMTRAKSLYTYYVPGNGFPILQETHDIVTTNVKRLQIQK